MGNAIVIVGYVRLIEQNEKQQPVIVEMALAGETIAGKIGGLFVKKNHGELKEIAEGAKGWRLFKEAVMKLE